MLVLNHLRNLWGNWWALPALPLLFVGAIALLGDLRSEHVIIVAIITFLAVATPTTKGLLAACIPGVAIGFGYELVRYIRPMVVKTENVLGCGLRAFEARLFPAGDGLTLADYFTIHNSAFWDVFFAIPYTIFWGVALSYSVLLYFWNRTRMKWFLWVLAVTHAISFVIWLVLPAAPPWYIQLHGCSIDLDALPNAAALLRLDALFNITYFEDFYSRVPFVFGALPSLHLAFPITGLVTAWRDAGWPERAIHFLYTVWMLAASVYLAHHWLLDGLLSIVIVVLVYAVFVRFFASFFSKTGR
ncbi:MAG: phosphatase PAP2 family protein [Fimbriimonadaceae bacterium]|nr:phosphatase PAP2 family protein [Alphaproteobacteria bacterium]